MYVLNVTHSHLCILSLRWNWNILMKNVTHRSDDSLNKNVEIQSTALPLPATAVVVVKCKECPKLPVLQSPWEFYGSTLNILQICIIASIIEGDERRGEGHYIVKYPNDRSATTIYCPLTKLVNSRSHYSGDIRFI